MTLRGRLTLASAYVVLLAVVSLAVPLILTFRDRVDGEVRQQATGQVDVVAATAADLLGAADRTVLRTLVRSAAGPARGRVIVVDARGRLLADSDAGPLGADYATQRPEIAAALRGRRVQNRRFSQSLNAELLVTAVPIIGADGRVAGAVRITQPVAAVQRAVRRSALSVLAVAFTVLAMGILAGVLVAGGIARPLRRLEAIARRIAGGDLAQRAPVEGSAEQRSLARSFNAMTDRLAGLLAARERFVADASHQLRTPLTGVRLRLEEARAMTDREDAAHELDAGMKEVDRLAAIVDDLLVLGTPAGAGAGGPIDLADAAHRAAARWQPQAAAAGVALEVVAEGPAAAHGLAAEDADRVLDVLVENAIRYAPRRPVQLRARPGLLEVRDHGPGLSDGEEDAVLERFHRGSAGRAAVAEGSGLGLSIAVELVAAAGGELTLRNADEGPGTVARVVLPAGGER